MAKYIFLMIAICVLMNYGEMSLSRLEKCQNRGNFKLVDFHKGLQRILLINCTIIEFICPTHRSKTLQRIKVVNSGPPEMLCQILNCLDFQKLWFSDINLVKVILLLF